MGPRQQQQRRRRWPAAVAGGGETVALQLRSLRTADKRTRRRRAAAAHCRGCALTSMIFCVTCGGALTGRFCARCGKDSQSATHLDVTSAARDDRGASPARYSAGKGGDRSRSRSRNKIDLRPGERSREREREQEREREKKREKQREREKERVRERPGISWEAGLGPTQIQTVVPGAGGRAATSPEDLPAQAPLPSPVFDLSRLAANRGEHSRTHARPPARPPAILPFK